MAFGFTIPGGTTLRTPELLSRSLEMDRAVATVTTVFGLVPTFSNPLTLTGGLTLI